MNKSSRCWQQLFTTVLIIISLLILNGCSDVQNKNTEVSQPVSLATIEKGKQLFNARCISCHRIHQELTGPALRGAEARWPDKQKLYAFIRNSEEVIRKDKYARELWLQYNQTIMLAQPDLTDEDIRAVLDYISNVTEK